MKHFWKLRFLAFPAVDQGDLPLMMKQGKNHLEKS
jgi:hypothetical protein